MKALNKKEMLQRLKELEKEATMSMDDFVITYFTKGPGVNTLSTLIYGEIRKGIKPEMYALSTILFLMVLIILMIKRIQL